MKKIFLTFIILSFSILSFQNTFSASSNCKFSWDVKGSLENCVQATELYKWGVKIDWGFKDTIMSWTASIALYLWIAAVFAIVYASAMLTLSAWDDEKINKAKNILKWSIFGLLWVMFAAVIITLVVNIIYNL